MKKIKIKVPEKYVIRDVSDYLNTLKMSGHVVWFTRVNSGAISFKNRFIRLAPAGTPDFIGMAKGGQFWAIECKGTGGRLSKEQGETILLINAYGGRAGVAYGADDVKKLFNL
jgi:hypothetical protein